MLIPTSQAAAPPVPEVINTESASTSSLIDVDMPSVHTVPSDFTEQDVQTETQAKRLEREAEAARAKADKAAKRAADKAVNKAKKTDSWLVGNFSKLSEGGAGAVSVANLATLIGVSAWLGYRAWGLYEQDRLSWQNIGAGVGIIAGVGAVESFIQTYVIRGQKK